MYFLQELQKFNLPKTMTLHFHTAIFEFIFTTSTTIWYTAAAKDKGRLQRAIYFAEQVISCNFPSLQDLYSSKIQKPAGKIVADCPLLPSGRTKFSHQKTVSSCLPLALSMKPRAPL